MRIIKLMTMANSNFKEPDLYRREEGGKEINERERVNPKDQSERENRENESRSGKTDQADSGAPPIVLEQSPCVRSEQVLKLKLFYPFVREITCTDFDITNFCHFCKPGCLKLEQFSRFVIINKCYFCILAQFAFLY